MYFTRDQGMFGRKKTDSTGSLTNNDFSNLDVEESMEDRISMEERESSSEERLSVWRIIVKGVFFTLAITSMFFTLNYQIFLFAGANLNAKFWTMDTISSMVYPLAVIIVSRPMLFAFGRYIGELAAELREKYSFRNLTIFPCIGLGLVVVVFFSLFLSVFLMNFSVSKCPLLLPLFSASYIFLNWMYTTLFIVEYARNLLREEESMYYSYRRGESSEGKRTKTCAVVLHFLIFASISLISVCLLSFIYKQSEFGVGNRYLSGHSYRSPMAMTQNKTQVEDVFYPSLQRKKRALSTTSALPSGTTERTDTNQPSIEPVEKFRSSFGSFLINIVSRLLMVNREAVDVRYG